MTLWILYRAGCVMISFLRNCTAEIMIYYINYRNVQVTTETRGCGELILVKSHIKASISSYCSSCVVVLVQTLLGAVFIFHQQLKKFILHIPALSFTQSVTLIHQRCSGQMLIMAFRWQVLQVHQQTYGFYNTFQMINT